MKRKEITKEYKEEKKSLRRSYAEKLRSMKAEYYSELDTLTDKRGNKLIKNPPERPILEEIGNSVTHLVGAAFAVVAFILMLSHSESAKQVFGGVVYFLGLFTMFTVSCLYHAFPYGSTVKRVFRRFDYSSIYLLIGATFAPILISYIGGTLGTVYLILQWTVIIAGITLVAVFGPTRLRFIHIPLYVILGWCGIVFIPEMIARSDIDFLAFILGGGVIYSLGIIPFALKGRTSHFIWHFFVLAGALVQWIGVYRTVYL